MFYLINKTSFEILDSVDTLKECYKMILSNLNKVAKSSINQVSDFRKVIDEGFYYLRLDNNIELRQYKIADGYVYSSLYYEHIGNYIIVQYEKKEEKNLLTEIKGLNVKNKIVKNKNISTF